ncbi:hydrolase [Streptomyces scabiei]|uniref:acyl-CoA dehydrogenase family protein n=1 Tax=Streptomyces scabiei TaxID=1930 RepID=UPI00298F9572|nr:acyl-CoA dehydrogenase family protein [Streptomyces scabiei]MDW8805232.1 hydrolase [Streptomyces scabiei]
MPSRPRSGAEFVSAAQEAAVVAARHAERADAERVLPRTVVEAVVDAGFARHFVPTHRGGAAGDTSDLLHAVSAVAEGCTSAAWCASVIAGAARMGAYLPEEGQHELWDKGPDTMVAGALIPRGSATPVADGWRVTGEWSFTSAVDFSDWALVCALVPHGGTPVPWFLALPRHDYRVVDTWTPVGMRGTGSNTLVVDDVFVPAHRGFTRADMISGRSIGSEARCHTAPLRLISGVLFGAPALGAARAALRAWSAHTASGGGTDDIVPAGVLARATIATDAAALLLERAARVADSPAASAVEQLRGPADCAYAVEQLVDVVERLLRTSGSAVQLAGHPLQRIWRDIHGLAGHVALRFDPAGAAYGARLLAGTTLPGPR